MLNIKFIRENQELLKKAVQNKNENADIDHLLFLEEKKRKLQYDFDQKRAHQKKVSKEIPMLKKKGEDVTDVLSEMKAISEEIKTINDNLQKVQKEFDQKMLTIPNIPDDDVPVGKDEESNEIIRTWGEIPKFDFTPVDHLTIANENGLLDVSRASKLSGSGFIGYLKDGARLERSLVNFMLDFHVKNHGYDEIALPLLVNRLTMTGTGQLPKLENDMYHIEQDDLFLIPTAEVSVTNFFSNEILNYKDLPKKMVSYSPCFRREAGSYGKDTKGLQRLHQFNKVEMVQLVKEEDSEIVLEQMLKNAEAILQALRLPYRVLKLATGDLSFASCKTYDLEVWASGIGRYLEVSSVSNFRDFQARRANLRYRDENGKVKFMHTLNGSGLATPRTMIALLENNQKESGSISISELLELMCQVR